MAQTVVGLFDRYDEAQHVVQELLDNGFLRENISVVANESARGISGQRAVGDDDRESAAAEGAGTGAVSGTVLGGALGLLVGAGLLAIPGIGPVLAAGPLAAAIGTTAATVGAGALGAGIGAATGGLLGGLVGAGVPKEHAEFYAEGVRRGGTLVAVEADGMMADRARQIMQHHDAVDIERRGAEYRQSGWSGFDPNAEPYSSTMGTDVRTEASTRSTIGGTGVTGRDLDFYDNDFRSHYQQTYSHGQYSYDDYRPVYSYGHSLASDPRFRDREWIDIEPEARRHWEQHNPNTWEQFKDTVRYSWEKVRGLR